MKQKLLLVLLTIAVALGAQAAETCQNLAQNGSLNGVYIVKIGNQTHKVIVK